MEIRLPDEQAGEVNNHSFKLKDFQEIYLLLNTNMLPFVDI